MGIRKGAIKTMGITEIKKETKMTEETKFESQFLKYVFDDDEKKEIAAEMAQNVGELNQAEDDKKAIMSDLKSKIDGLGAMINSAATKLTNGYEMRNIKCKVVPNYTKRVWEYTRADNGELAKEKPMASDDLQMEFD